MERQHLLELVFKTMLAAPHVTLITLKDGSPVPRPVSGILTHEDAVFVITNASSRKIQQVQADPHAAIHCFVERDWMYCTLTGTGSVSNDRALKEKFWRDELRRYFALGIEDPDYCLLKIDIRSAELVNYSEGFNKPVIDRQSW